MQKELDPRQRDETRRDELKTTPADDRSHRVGPKSPSWTDDRSHRVGNQAIGIYRGTVKDSDRGVSKMEYNRDTTMDSTTAGTMLLTMTMMTTVQTGKTLREKDATSSTTLKNWPNLAKDWQRNTWSDLSMITESPGMRMRMTKTMTRMTKTMT